MLEACSAAISWVTAEFGSSSIEAFVDPGNGASIKLVQRPKFSSTGESKDGADRYSFDPGNA